MYGLHLIPVSRRRKKLCIESESHYCVVSAVKYFVSIFLFIFISLNNLRLLLTIKPKCLNCTKSNSYQPFHNPKMLSLPISLNKSSILKFFRYSLIIYTCSVDDSCLLERVITPCSATGCWGRSTLTPPTLSSAVAPGLPASHPYNACDLPTLTRTTVLEKIYVIRHQKRYEQKL